MAPPIKCACGHCRRCRHREYMREYYHRENGTAYSSGGSVLTACQECGKTLVRTRRKMEWTRGIVYCSRSCKDKARNRRTSETLAASKPERRCIHCGEDIPNSMRSDAKFCSERCNQSAHALWAKMQKRAKKLGPRKTRVRRVEIADRDNWRCGICGGRISQKLSHPDPGAMSIDHIIPISEGGSNEPENLRATHLRCNLGRQDRGGGEQLRLIG